MPLARLEGFLTFPARFTARRTLAGAAIAILPLVAACGDDSPKPIKDVREGRATTDFKPSSTADRFGFSRTGQQVNPHHGMQGAPDAGFESTTPEGWEEMPPSQMRQANFRLKRDPQVECYLSIVQGGVAANVLRWRKQMKLEPITPAAIAGLPQEPFMGQGGVFVDLEGTFVGMGQGEPREGYRMLGIVVEEPGRTVTLKMTGPAAVVAEEREHFLELAKSFRAAAAPAAAPEGGDGPKFDMPTGWEQRPAQQMRLVTVGPRDSAGTECYVTVLSGAAGGVEANLNRWRDQMGQPPLSSAEIEALGTVQLLGQEAKFIEVTGSFTDMQGNKSQSAGLLGVVCPLNGAMLFVKMTGPADVVSREKDRFLAFCGSLRLP